MANADMQVSCSDFESSLRDPRARSDGVTLDGGPELPEVQAEVEARFNIKLEFRM